MINLIKKKISDFVGVHTSIFYSACITYSVWGYTVIDNELIKALMIFFIAYFFISAAKPTVSIDIGVNVDEKLKAKVDSLGVKVD